MWIPLMAKFDKGMVSTYFEKITRLVCFRASSLANFDGINGAKLDAQLCTDALFKRVLA